jgi:uncharacterized protein (DUF1778 family)
MTRPAAAQRRASATPSGTINIRIKPGVRALIDRAAVAQGKSRSDFMLEASRRAAEEALLDRTLFVVDAPTYKRFLALLDAPTKRNAQLRKLFDAKPPWE